MTDSDFLDFSSKEMWEEGSSSARRRRPRLFTAVLLVALVGLPLLALWVHLGRVHASDLAAFEKLRDDFVLVDRNHAPLQHGDSPPCVGSDDAGVLERSYSPETGPTPNELSDQLRVVGFRPTAATPGALITLDKTVDDHRLVVDVMGSSADGITASLRATSSATSLACRLR